MVVHCLAGIAFVVSIPISIDAGSGMTRLRNEMIEAQCGINIAPGFVHPNFERERSGGNGDLVNLDFVRG